MNNRQSTFTQKFIDAKKYLGNNSIHDLVSIKYHDNVNQSSYREFVAGFLQSKTNLKIEKASGDFGGSAWLVQDSNLNKALLVEHETGLEILYIAGSIASLLSLIPLIISGWRFVRNRYFDRPFSRNPETKVEIRIINNNNQLMEQHIMRIEDYIFSESMREISALKERVEQLEKELRKANENKSQKDNKKKQTRTPQRTKK